MILTVTFLINASPEKVWQALTDPALVKSYFFGTDLVTSWQVGSPIYFRGEWDGKKYEDKGTVLAFEPVRLIHYSYWSSFSDKADAPENYANVAYELAKEGEGTRLTITQDKIQTEEIKKHSEENWKSVMNGMKKMVES